MRSNQDREAGTTCSRGRGIVPAKGKNFLAVIDADPSSPAYGHLLTTLVTDQTTLRVLHTEYTMPESGMLFANDHEAGRTFIFDLRDPLHPTMNAKQAIEYQRFDRTSDTAKLAIATAQSNDAWEYLL